MTARNRVVREPYATWCGRTPVEIIHGLLPDLPKIHGARFSSLSFHSDNAACAGSGRMQPEYAVSSA